MSKNTNLNNVLKIEGRLVVIDINYEEDQWTTTFELHEGEKRIASRVAVGQRGTMSGQIRGLTGLVEALESLKASCTQLSVRLSVDKPQIKKGLEEWLPKWRKDGKCASKNPDLWRRLEKQLRRHGKDTLITIEKTGVVLRAS